MDLLADHRENWKSEYGWQKKLVGLPTYEFDMTQKFYSCDFDKVITAEFLHGVFLRGNVCDLYSSEQYLALVDEIKLNGIQTPVYFARGVRGLLNLENGHHRMASFFALGRNFIPYILRS